MTTVYNFDRTDRFYIGEEEADFCQITGTPLVPGYATLLPPPSKETDREQIAVFVNEDLGWKLVENNFWQPPQRADRPTLGNALDGNLDILQYPWHRLCRYAGVPRVMASSSFGLALSGRLAYMQRRVKEVVAIYDRRNEGLAFEDLVYEKISTEDLVLQMKRVVDEIFMNEWILLEGKTSQFENDHVIRVCEMQDIDKLPRGPTKNHLTRLRDEDPEFFSTLTDLRNSFVHHFPVAEAYVLYGIDRPTVNTLHVPKGRLNDMRLIEVWLEDLVKSFNRLLIRTFGSP